MRYGDEYYRAYEQSRWNRITAEMWWLNWALAWLDIAAEYGKDAICDDCGRWDGHDADCFYHGPY